jgi:hypothetical protein
MSDNKVKIQQVLDKYHLTIDSVFVPFSKSRNSGEKNPSLNWLVTLKQNDKKILSTNYMAGCGYCPSYKQKETIYSHEHVLLECEKGYTSTSEYGFFKKPILPDTQDVIHSLLIDSEVLDYDSFESWSNEFGYDSDSRKDEKIYNDCMKIALSMNRIDFRILAELRDVYQDY